MTSRILIIPLVLILSFTACTPSRLIVEGGAPDTLGVFLSLSDPIALEMEQEYRKALTRQLIKQNAAADIHYMLVDTEKPYPVVYLDITKVRLNDRTAQFIALGIDVFGVFIFPALLREVDSPVRFRFVVPPYDRTHYSVHYRGNDSYESNQVKKAAGRVPFFEGEELKRKRQAAALAEHFMGVLEGVTWQSRERAGDRP